MEWRKNPDAVMRLLDSGKTAIGESDWSKIGKEFDVSWDAARKAYDWYLKEKKMADWQPLKSPYKYDIPNGTVFAYGDVHIPFQDEDALSIAMEVSVDINPDLIIIQGDLMDNYKVSSFLDEEPDKHDYADELKQTRAHLFDLSEIHPEAEKIYLLSNHEARLYRYLLKNAPALHNVSEVKLQNLLRVDELGIKCVAPINKESYVDLGKLLVGHWNRAYKHSAYTAKNLLDDIGTSLLQAHTHRMGAYHKTLVGREVVAYENGCLCSLTPEYKSNPNWQHGFSVITFIDGYFCVQPVPIIRTDTIIFAIYGDKMYQREIPNAG